MKDRRAKKTVNASGDWAGSEDFAVPENSEKKKRIIVISAIAILVVLLAAIFFSVYSDFGDSEDDDDSGAQGQDELTDEGSDLEGGSSGTIFTENYDSTDLPVEKHDYAEHPVSLINEGIADYLARCYGRVVVNEEIEYEDPEIEVEYIEPTDSGTPLCTGETGDRDYSSQNSIRHLEDSAEIVHLLENTVDEEVAFLSSHFPQRSEGYTNNPVEAFEDDGSMNPYYSFVLGDDINFFFSHQVEKLINPHYGEWAEYQHSGSDAINLFPGHMMREMFTESWWRENVGRFAEDSDHSALPVFADWDDDDYQAVLKNANISSDVSLTDDDIRWVGEIEEYSFDYYETYEGRSFGIDARLNVTYTSETSDGGTVSLPAQLDITMIPNYDNPDLHAYRLVIDEATLVIEEYSEERNSTSDQ